MDYREEQHGDKGRSRHGSPTFYKLLNTMAELHDKKSHDYASNEDPYGNYRFAGKMALFFDYSPNDAGYFGRFAEKIYRIKNLESAGKIPKNEDLEETENDICVIVALWMADRKDRRNKMKAITDKIRQQMREGTWEGITPPQKETQLNQKNQE